jgi:hypothetical protein
VYFGRMIAEGCSVPSVKVSGKANVEPSETKAENASCTAADITALKIRKDRGAGLGEPTQS